MLRNFFIVLIGLFFLVADQIIKFFLPSFLKPHETMPVIKNIFHITLVLNTGCAFGLFKGQPSLLFLIISISAILFLAYFLKRLKGGQVFSKIAAVLLITGSLSNLIDRLRVGCVIDFLDFRIWPVFNLGDTAITIGAILFGYLILKSSRHHWRRDPF